MKDYKVLHINFSHKGGGAEQFAVDLARRTTSSLFTKDRLLTAEGESTRHRTSRLRLWSNKVTQKVSRHRNLNVALGYHDSFHSTYAKLNRIKEYRDAKIIHLHNIHGGWFDLKSLVRICREKHVIWTLHDMWAMTGGEAYLFGHQMSTLDDTQTPYLSHYPLSSPLFDRRKKYLKLKKKIYEVASDINFVPVSDWLADSISKSFVWNEQMRLHTIKNGVDRSVFNLQHEPTQRKRPKKRLLFFNSTSPFKGSDNGLKALESIQLDAEIWIIGKPVASIKDCVYLGEKIEGRAELAHIFNSVDILFFPSLAENMPLTILEAMSCGVVVVSTPIGGITEIVRPGQTGLLAKSTNVIDLIEVLKATLSNPLDEYSKESVSFIERYHNMDKMVEAYLSLYAEAST